MANGERKRRRRRLPDNAYERRRRGLGYRNTRASRGSCSIMKREPPAVIETRLGLGVILHLHLHLQWPFVFVLAGSSSTSRKHHSPSIVHRSFSNCNYKIDRRLEARGSRLYSGTCLAVSERTVTTYSRTVPDGALAVNHPSITCIRTITYSTCALPDSFQPVARPRRTSPCLAPRASKGHGFGFGFGKIGKPD